MGSAVGQVPEYVEMVARWCKAHTRMPVIVKLTPNITDIKHAGAGGEKWRRGRRLAHQHGQLDHGDRSRRDGPGGRDRRQGHPWGHVRAGGQADRARDGGGHRPRPGVRRPADIGDRRHHDLARRGRIHRARRRQRAGLHRGDDLRLQGRRGDDLGPRAYMDARATRRSTTSAAAPFPSVTDWQHSISIMSSRRKSIRISASSAAAATSSARTRRTRRSSPM